MYQGDFYYERGEYGLALSYYEAYLEERPSDVSVSFKLFKLYIDNLNVTGAKKVNKVLNYSTLSSNLEYQRLLVKFYHLTGEFELAIKLGKKLNKKRPSKELEKVIEHCQNGIAYKKNPVELTSFELPIIKGDGHVLYPNFNVLQNELIFSSDINNTHTDVYRTKIIDSNYLVEKLPGYVNTGLGEVCVGGSPDLNLIFIYRTVNGGDLFYSIMENGLYQEPTPFFFNSDFKESSVTISPDGNILVFAREANGKSDLFISRLSNDSIWSQPELFELSTSFNERTPFFHNSGEYFFFSVDGGDVIGGYDVMYSKWVNGQWSDVKNIGYPINSPVDELGFTLAYDGQVAMFSSNDSIGQMNLTSVSIESHFTSSSWLYRGVCLNEKQEGVEAYLSLTDIKSGNVVRTLKSRTNGEFTVVLSSDGEYGLQIIKKGYSLCSKRISQITNSRYIDTILMIKEEQNIPVVLENVFFESGTALLKVESHYELDAIAYYLQKLGSPKVLLTGYTDDVGDFDSNKELSLKRAEAVKSYLVKKGLSSNRVECEGRGELNPRLPNTSETNRSANRRVEIKIN